MVNLMQRILTRFLASLPDRWHRQLGVQLSKWIYYGRPFAVRRLERLYRPFVPPGGLAFDIGAHVGNRTAAFTRLGARVIAVEPSPACLTELRARFANAESVQLVPAAIGSASGVTQLHISQLTPSVSTTSPQWLRRVRETPGFSWVRWDEQVSVPVLSMDQLIDDYGPPDFVKLDVEGAELQALNGLSRALPAMSFEHTVAQSDVSLACIERLEQLGGYEFNWCLGEQARLASGRWLRPGQVAQVLSGGERIGGSADVFARRIDPARRGRASAGEADDGN